MNVPWFDGCCLSKKGAVRDYKEAWQATRYLVGGKMFALAGGDRYGKPIGIP
ncbi:MAG: hypothetical protein GX424_08340 [Clostridiales bacterium]|jgi:predicted DNA-binding protein (MmcQ/YjbR family)|nr:hypothetical protein [Clostridiales bacterium]